MIICLEWEALKKKKKKSSGYFRSLISVIVRLKKQELASLAMSAKDILREAEISAQKSVRDGAKHGQEVEKGKELALQDIREKIVLSIQDKDVVKQFRIYMVRLFLNPCLFKRNQVLLEIAEFLKN